MKNFLILCFNLLSLISLVQAEFADSSKEYNKAIGLDLCTLEPERGSCDKKIRRYYYNTLIKRCTYFTYSGCEGNPNSFHTKKECQENCPGKFMKTRKPLHCFYEHEKGLCNDNIPSFYYDWKTDRCEKFIYGGCHGNNNRFTSSDKCINECRTYEFNLQMKS